LRVLFLAQAAPPLLGVAVTEASAEFLDRWADGLMTVSGRPEQVQKVVEVFRRGEEGKPLFDLNWAPTEDEALQGRMSNGITTSLEAR
jgi:coenzyme F420-dependent glucose-6-phosphate dehydrogenase